MKGSIVDIHDISDIVDPDFSKKPTGERSSTYKILYRLKAHGIITPIRQGIYYIPDNEDTKIEAVIEENYWSIVKKILSHESDGEYFISGNKALEILMKDYSVPKKLIVSGK